MDVKNELSAQETKRFFARQAQRKKTTWQKDMAVMNL